MIFLFYQNAAYLIIRGMKTLHLRVQQQNSTAMRMAEILEGHPKVHFYSQKFHTSPGVFLISVHKEAAAAVLLELLNLACMCVKSFCL